MPCFFGSADDVDEMREDEEPETLTETTEAGLEESFYLSADDDADERVNFLGRTGKRTGDAESIAKRYEEREAARSCYHDHYHYCTT